MAALQAEVNFSSVALTAATAKSLAGFKAPANQVVKLLEMAVSFDGVTVANPSAVVDLCRSTFATNAPGTGSPSYTPGKKDPGRAETVQATAAVNWSSEPTVLTVYRTLDVPQFGGMYHYICPLTSPILVVGGQGMVLRVNSPQAVNSSGFLSFEE